MQSYPSSSPNTQIFLRETIYFLLPFLILYQQNIKAHHSGSDRKTSRKWNVKINQCILFILVLNYLYVLGFPCANAPDSNEVYCSMVCSMTSGLFSWTLEILPWMVNRPGTCPLYNRLHTAYYVRHFGKISMWKYLMLFLKKARYWNIVLLIIPPLLVSLSLYSFPLVDNVIAIFWFWLSCTGSTFGYN